MDLVARRDLELLEAVAQNRAITQRTLSRRLGVALGLTNLYVKRLVRKGYIKCVNVRPNRLLYLITPQGIAAKTRLTYEFMNYSLILYRQVRKHLKTKLEPYGKVTNLNVAICGTGEAAELTYLSLKECGLEPVAVFDTQIPATFLGMSVLPVHQHRSVRYDLLIIASLERSATLEGQLVLEGVPPQKMLLLWGEAGPRGEGEDEANARITSTSEKRN